MEAQSTQAPPGTKYPTIWPFTRAQILKALQSHNLETVAEVAKRVDRSHSAVHNWYKAPDAINSSLWNRILRAYNVDEHTALEIARNSPQLKPTVAEAEQAARDGKTSQSRLQDDGKYAGRLPKDRLPGEVHWYWQRRYGADPLFYEFGTVEKPFIEEGQRCYGVRASLMLQVFDALQKLDSDGKAPTREMLVEGYAENYAARVPLIESLEEGRKIADIEFRRLIRDGDIIEGADGSLGLSEAVYGGILRCAQGDPMKNFLIYLAHHGESAFQYVGWKSRGLVIQDLLRPEPEVAENLENPNSDDNLV